MANQTVPQLCMNLPSFAADDPGGWGHMLATAQAADAAGVDCLMISDHVVFGERTEEYGRPEIGGAKGGKQPTGPDGHWLEPLTAIAWLAGQTRRVDFRTNIVIAALRRPVVLAKSAATLDVLSGGRLSLGVGVGWQREEYEAAGLDFDTRGKLLDHTLDVCRALWTQQRASFASPELTFENIHQMPKPTEPGGVPIWISGTFRASTVRRLATYGPRWVPWGPDAGDIVNAAPRMRDAVAAAGGSVEGMRIVGNLAIARDDSGAIEAERSIEALAPMLAAGVTEFSIRLRPEETETGDPAPLRAVVDAFRAATGREAVGEP
jgi:probable F420-dependent oxidoreductase